MVNFLVIGLEIIRLYYRYLGFPFHMLIFMLLDIWLADLMGYIGQVDLRDFR